GSTVCKACGKETTPRLRAISSRRGGAITATSVPLEKITCPVHHENSSLARYDPIGPRFSGGGIELRARDSPPVDDWLACRSSGRANADVTMRVAAIGE